MFRDQVQRVIPLIFFLYFYENVSQVFGKEDDDGPYVNDDNLSDIKEDLVDEAREDQKTAGSDGGKSDSDDKGKFLLKVQFFWHFLAVVSGTFLDGSLGSRF